MPKAVFLVPAHHEDVFEFIKVAKHCRNDYWGKANSIIFKVTWDEGPSFQLLSDVPAGFSASFWHSLEAAEQFILICHYANDGPILGPGGQQPWPTIPYQYPDTLSGDGKELTEDAKAFWRRVSWAIGSDGKILIAGCDSGNTYGPLVAKLMPLKVYGFKEHIGTARVEVADKYIGGQFFHNATGHNLVRC